MGLRLRFDTSREEIGLGGYFFSGLITWIRSNCLVYVDGCPSLSPLEVKNVCRPNDTSSSSSALKLIISMSSLDKKFFDVIALINFTLPTFGTLSKPVLYELSTPPSSAGLEHLGLDYLM